MSITSGVIKMLFGSKSDKDRKLIEPIVRQITAIYPTIEALSNDELRAKTWELQELIQQRIAPQESEISNLKIELENPEIDIVTKEKLATKIDHLVLEVDKTIEVVLNEILPTVFAIVKDTARRFTQNETLEVTAHDCDRELATKREFVTIEGDKAIYKTEWMAGGNMIKWDMIHYDVQLFGGVVLHKGNIAEMATGEGKTLVATLPVFLNAMSRKGVHIVTVNDYLARRDSEWMGPLYQFHGMTVDCIDRHQPNSEERHAAYAADITFGTNNEYGFDYLRGNMATDVADIVQRKLQYAIVDEVDSILIDDARTPLIISGPVPRGDDQMFEQYRPSIEDIYKLQRAECTKCLAEAKKLIAAEDTEKGGLQLYRSHKGLPKSTPLIKFLTEPGIKAIMLKAEAVYMQNNSARMTEVTDELYFVIDEKNNQIELTDKGHDQLSKTYEDRNFFILPDIGGAIAMLEHSDKGEEERVEVKDRLLAEYSTKTERIHTVNQLLKAYSLFDKDSEYVVQDNKVMIVDEQTGRILDGRRYSDGLHQAIEAKERVKVEAATQTFATITLQNYFRMYHKLAGMTGTAETEASELWNIYKLDVMVIPTNRPISRKDEIDIIYRSKREKYKAVIDEIERLIALGRPVLVGTTSVEISELLSRQLSTKNIKHNVLNAKQHQSEARIVAEAGQPGQVTIATNMAGRGTDIKLSASVKEAGGLAIIGTERHESRRVDRQLRGRAGRQGDDGSSQFFVSLEDDLMRLFGSDRVTKIIKIKEGESFQAGMMNSAIERAQKKIEENNFGMRKRLLEYDDVMNSQRQVVYTRRRHALGGERIDVDLNNMMSDYAEMFVQENRGLPFDEFNLELIRELSIESSITESEYENMTDAQMADRLHEDLQRGYQRRIDNVAQTALPVLRNVLKEHGDSATMISIPMTDGLRGFNIQIDLKKAVESNGTEITKVLTQRLMLLTIDEKWKEHLRDMDDLKQSVQNASYEQKDPLLIYKMESFGLFEKMIQTTNREILSVLLRIYIPVAANARPTQEQQRQSVDMSKMQATRNEAALNAGAADRSRPAPVHVEKSVGRNDLCPCGSGKKYKSCHGAS